MPITDEDGKYAGRWHTKFMGQVNVLEFFNWLKQYPASGPVRLGYFYDMPGCCEGCIGEGWQLDSSRVKCETCLIRALKGLDMPHLFSLRQPVICPHGIHIPPATDYHIE